MNTQKLRNGCVYYEDYWTDRPDYIDEAATDALLAQAADEIEMLRRERDNLATRLRSLAQSCPREYSSTLDDERAAALDALKENEWVCKNAIDPTTPESQTPQPHDTHD